MAASWLDRTARASCVEVTDVTNLSMKRSASAGFCNIFSSVPKVKISCVGKRRPCISQLLFDSIKGLAMNLLLVQKF